MESEKRPLAWLGILIAVLSFTLFQAAFITLGSAIQWPDSLDYPPERIFPLLIEKASAVYSGYYMYLMYSLLLIPIVQISGGLFTDRGTFWSVQLMKVAVGFAVASAVLRALGIVRWQYAMMYLAGVHEQPEASAAAIQTTEIVFQTLNLYAGKVGEHLGVGLTGSLMLAFYGLALLGADLNRKWLGWLSLIVATLIIPLEDFFSFIPDFYITFSTTVFLLWILVVAGALFRLQSREL
ncbi:MAG: hypothetical protein CMN76_17120 [Spirochaetaceae bacterium]|nr:hypothetical protein [Spirochaetaceae bacterium]|tara:strand:- start:47856 stop:48569 length:714 start_codon:yes stop_codon:yes gene_type:complete